MLPYEVDCNLTAKQWIFMTSNLKHSEVLKCRPEDLSVYQGPAGICMFLQKNKP